MMDSTSNLPDQVHQENEIEFDPVTGDQHIKRQMILSRIAEHYNHGSMLDDLNAEERSAIDDTSLNNILSDTYPGVIRELKLESLEKFMISLERDMKNPDFFPKPNMIFKLNEITYLGSEAMKTDGTRISKLLIKVVCDDIERKYDAESPLILLSRIEFQVLQSIRPHLGDVSYPENILALHWRLTESGLDEDMVKLVSDPEFEVRNVQRLSFLSTEGRVPKNIKAKAVQLRTMNEDTIIERLPYKYDLKTNVDELSETEKAVLEHLAFGPEQHDPVVEYLRWEVIHFILSKEFETFKVGTLTVKHHMPKRIYFFLTNDRVPDKTKQMAEKWINMVTDDIERKYDAETPLDHLSLCEIQVLESLPLLLDDTLYPKPVVALHWRQIEIGLEEDIDQLVSDPEFQVRNVQRLRFLSTEGRVPKNIKAKADQLRTIIEDIVIEQLPHKYDLETNVNELNEAEKSVLEKLAFGLKKHDPVVEYLRWEVIDSLLSKEFEAFKLGTLTVKHHMPKSINIILRNDRVPDKTKQMAEQWINIVTDDIERKYDAETPLDHLSLCEIQVLESLPLLLDDTLYPKTVVALHWRQIESGLDEDMDKLVSDPEFEVRNMQRLRLLSTEGRVPKNIKAKADQLRTINEDTIIERLPHKYDLNTNVDELNETEKAVLEHLAFVHKQHDPVVEYLRWEVIHYLLSKEFETFKVGTLTVKYHMPKSINIILRNDRVPDKTKQMAEQWINIVTDDIERKYDTETPLDHLSLCEIQVLESLPLLLDDTLYPKTVVALHWRQIESGLDKDMEKLVSDPEFEVRNGQRLRFLSTEGRVPKNIKAKADQLRTMNEDTVLKRLPHKYDLETNVTELNEREKSVLEKLAFGHKQHDPVVEYLRWEVIHFILSKEFETFKVGTLTVKHHMPKRIYFFLTNDRVPDKTKQMAEKWINMVTDDIERKYDAETPLGHLSLCEIQVLESLPLLLDDALYPKTVEALHWRQIEIGLEEDMDQLVSDPEFQVRNVQRLRFLSTEGRVPKNIKAKADQLRTIIEDIVIEQLPHKYDLETNVNELNEAEKAVLEKLAFGLKKQDPVVEYLRWEVIDSLLSKEFEAFKVGTLTVKYHMPKSINIILRNDRVPDKTKQKAEQWINIVTDDIERKYDAETPLDHLSLCEIQVLESLPLLLDDTLYPKTVVALHWRQIESGLDEDMDKLVSDPEFEVRNMQRLRLLSTEGRVPKNIKAKADQLRTINEDTIIERLPHKYDLNTNVDELNETEKAVLEHLAFVHKQHDPVVEYLRWEVIHYLLSKEFETFKVGTLTVKYHMPKSINIILRNDRVPDKTKQMAEQWINIVTDDIERKYDAETPLDHLSLCEIQVLESLPLLLDDTLYPKTVVALHWRQIESGLDEDMDKLVSDPEFEVRNMQRLRLLSTEGRVPKNIKAKADQLRTINEDTIIERLPHKYDLNTNVDELNEAEKAVLEHLAFVHKQHDPVVEYLRWEVIHYLLSKEFETFKVGTLTVKYHMPKSINIILRNDRVPDKTKQMAEQWINIVTDDIERKYDAETPLDHLSLCEIQVLESLPLLLDDTLYPKTVVALHWRQIESGLDEDMDKLVSDPEFEVRNMQRLRLLSTEGRAPKNIKAKADQLLTMNEDTKDTIIERLPHKYNLETDVNELNEAEKSVLEHLAFGYEKHDPVVEYLRWEVIHVLLSKEFEAFKVGTLTVKHQMPKKLYIFLNHDRVPDKTKEMAKQWIKIVGDDIERKYNAEIPISHLSLCEFQIIRSIRPFVHGASCPETVIKLHWRIIEHILDKDLIKVASDPGYVFQDLGLLKHLIKDSRVPAYIKTKAKEVQKLLKVRENDVTEGLPYKYGLESSVDELTEEEVKVLERLDVIHDSYHPVVENLHWKVTYSVLCSDHENIKAGKHATTYLLRKLDFLSNNENVPVIVKEKTKEIQQEISN